MKTKFLSIIKIETPQRVSQNNIYFRVLWLGFLFLFSFFFFSSFFFPVGVLWLSFCTLEVSLYCWPMSSPYHKRVRDFFIFWIYKVHRSLNSLVTAGLIHPEFAQIIMRHEMGISCLTISSPIPDNIQPYNFCQFDGYKMIVHLCFNLQLLIANDVENFSTNLMAIMLSSFVNYLLIFFAHFLIGFIFLIYSQ